MAAAPDMSMRAESSTPSEVDNDNDNDNDHFFNAAPGVKRANSNDSERQDENMNILASASASRPYTATTSAAHARSSSTTKTSHKRIRTQAPAPPQGIKRTGAPIRRLSDIQTTTEQQQLSDSDTSFSRRPPPKKRVRSVAPPPATASYGTTASTSRSHHVRGESVPTLDERAVTLPRKKPRKIASRPLRHADTAPSTFNFTPVTNIHPSLTVYDIDSILEQVDALRLHANEQYRNGQYEEALVTYSRALDQYPTGAADVAPPLVLLTNRAAAYIALGKWEEALQDMRKSVTYPCDEADGNVKRFTRYIKCLIVLGKLAGVEVDEVIKHTSEQLDILLVEVEKGHHVPRKVHTDGNKALQDLVKGRDTLVRLEQARSSGNYEKAIVHLEDLFDLRASMGNSKGVSIPEEWHLMHIEALFWEGKFEEGEQELDMATIDRLSPNTAAYCWLAALRFYALGNMESTMINLNTMRACLPELPSQASRLLHRAYSIDTLFKRIASLIKAKKWQKITAAAEEILRMVSSSSVGPKSPEATIRAEVFKNLAQIEMGMYDEVLHAYKQMPKKARDPATKLLARANYARALHATNRVKEATRECTEALKLAGDKSRIRDEAILEAVSIFDGILADIRRREAEAREGMVNALPHEVLGISSTATKAEVKKAYKALSLKYHPDKPEGDDEMFKVINDAYQKLVATPATLRTYGSSSRYR